MSSASTSTEWLVCVQSQYFRDPPKINEYVATTCAATAVTGEVERRLAGVFVDGYETVAAGDGLTVCVDIEGYLEEYGECVPSFPDAFAFLNFLMIF